MKNTGWGSPGLRSVEAVSNTRNRVNTLWCNENNELYEWLEANQDKHSFLSDMVRTINKKGELSPAQATASYKWMEGAKKLAERAAEAAEKLSNVSPVPEGRTTLKGTILSAKWKYSDYGEQLKMVVELPDGNKVYGTMPKSLRAVNAEKGTEVKFTATVKRSDTDDHFGFFSKPSNAEVI